MASREFILFPPSAPDMPWRIGTNSGTDVVISEVPAPRTIPPAAVATLLSEALRQQGYRGSAIALAVPSTWCMAASVSLADLSKHDTQALLYRLEEQLPLPAESLAADFVLSEDTALGVCARVEHLRPWVLALESLGIPLQSIAPEALLAAQTFVNATDPTFILLLSEESGGAVGGEAVFFGKTRIGQIPAPSPGTPGEGWGEGNLERKASFDVPNHPHPIPLPEYQERGPDALSKNTATPWAEAMVNVIVIQEQKPIGWSLVPSQIETLSLEIDVMTMKFARPLRWRSIGMGTPFVDALAQRLGPPFVEEDQSLTPAKAATEGGAATLAGRAKPWVELRQGSLAAHDPRRLHRRALNALLASAAIGLLAVNGAMILRAGRYDAQAKSSERKMLDGFHAAFPGWTTPANVRVLLESEHRKLLKTTSAGGNAQPVGSALQTLVSVLGRLPADLPVRVDRMTFNDDSFELQGRVRSYGDVGALAVAARGGGLEVPTPQARRETDGYWSFVVRGNSPTKPANGAPAKQSATLE